MLVTGALMLSAWGGAASSVPAHRIFVKEIRALQYGPDSYQLLDLYLPAQTGRAGPVPTIVYLHSGGWIGGGRASVANVAAAQVTRGYAVASVDYRLATPGGPGSFPAAVYDVKRAVRFLKAGAKKWDLDPARMVLMGTSAGGHLAALSGASVGQLEPDLTGPLAGVDSRVVAVVDIVGITDLTTFSTTPHPWAAPLTAAFLGCPLRDGEAVCSTKLLRAASVAPYLSPKSPPIFMAYGAADNLVVPSTQGAPLAEAWVQSHRGDPRSAVYEVVPAAGHNIGVAQIDMSKLDTFLDHAVGQR